MREILFALSLALAAPLPAQVSYQFANFATYTGAGVSGFRTTLLLRNTSKYSDAGAPVLRDPFTVSLSPRVRTACLATASGCGLSGGASYGFGEVQQATFRVGEDLWIGGGRFTELGCSSFFCFSVFYESDAGGVLGCNLPPGGRVYVARTCDADGYTGSVAIDLLFEFRGRGDATLSVTAEDLLSPTIPGAVLATPEPSTWGLMAFGLGAVGLVRRKRLA
ncbi:MAG: PEP-CTERM sorting domain-containing protein [Gemmatimonadaceae bacterium]